MDHPYDFLGVQKLSSILLFEYQNVVLVRIFHGLAHFFFKIFFRQFLPFFNTEILRSLLTERHLSDKIKAS